MDYGEYLERLRSHRRCAEITEYGAVVEGGKAYPLLKVTVPGKKPLVITAGFHGEEPAGPLTLVHHLPEVVDHARSRGVGLTIFPCVNPSGFEAGTRYNLSGERPNNDFLRYEIAPGEWVGELRDGQTFLRHVLYDGGPKETRALRGELERLPTPLAALDLHQDNYMSGACTYAYVFGDRAHYVPLMEAAARHALVAAACAVDEHHRSDHDGLIYFHDGSVTDYFMRRGVGFTAALETTTQTRLEDCHGINLIWIRGFIELAARSAQRSELVG